MLFIVFSVCLIGNTAENEIDLSLSESADSLIQSALGCDVTAVDNMCGLLMQRANHVINISNQIIPSTDQPGRPACVMLVICIFGCMCVAACTCMLYIEFGLQEI